MRVKRCLIVLVLAVAAVPASGQGVIEGREEIDFDRPEAWGMKYFAAVSMFTSLGPPRSTDFGKVELAAELDWIPRLDEDQRRIGFNGTKVEDLNKLPVFFRPRLRVGLGRDWALDVGYVPPLELKGVKSHILSLAAERPVLLSHRWSLGLRLFGQVGEIEGDFTCSEEDAAIDPGAPGNDFGCNEPSRDTATLNYAGAAVTGGYRLGEGEGRRLHFALGTAYNDLEFQVDALTYGVRDRSLLVTDGWTYFVTAGLSWALGERVVLGGELYYSPLDVVRPPSTEAENDALFNVRTVLRYGF